MRLHRPHVYLCDVCLTYLPSNEGDYGEWIEEHRGCSSSAVAAGYAVLITASPPEGYRHALGPLEQLAALAEACPE